nr:MAG TPA: Methylamine utilization protein [Caudoviricetes sp.]
MPSTAQGVINCSCFGADRKTRFDWSRNDWRKNI